MIRTKPMVQQEIITKFCEPLDYAGIFSDYGTGKTLASLMITELKKYKKILIVATKTAIDTTWCDEVRNHTDFRFCILRGTAKQKATILEFALGKVSKPDRYGDYGEGSKPMLFFINYEAIKSLYYELRDAKFDAVFADESTKIKTFDTERTLALYELGEYIPNRYIMTGFPVTENSR